MLRTDRRLYCVQTCVCTDASSQAYCLYRYIRCNCIIISLNFFLSHTQFSYFHSVQAGVNFSPNSLNLSELSLNQHLKTVKDSTMHLSVKCASVVLVNAAFSSSIFFKDPICTHFQGCTFLFFYCSKTFFSSYGPLLQHLYSSWPVLVSL